MQGSLGKALRHALWTFLRTYVVRRGFLDGRLGFALAMSNAEGTYYRYLKLWLLQQGIGQGTPAQRPNLMGSAATHKESGRWFVTLGDAGS